MKHIAPSKPPAVAGFNAAGLEHYCAGPTASCGETALLLRGCAQRVGSGPAARSRRTQWLRGLGQRPYSASVRSLPEWAETGWPRALSGTGRDRHACVTVLAVV
ncbi:hypothetical protein ABDF71_24285 [Ochrobactrum sp. WV_118_8]